MTIIHFFIDLDRIITQIVKPKVSVFLAIDGVAPRAKLNQQRSRRFRSAKDRIEAIQETQRKNPLMGSMTAEGMMDGLFDSNCITPGTDFMARVSKTIHYFIRKKLKEDIGWRHLKVIFSGPEVPGMFWKGGPKCAKYFRFFFGIVIVCLFQVDLIFSPFTFSTVSNFSQERENIKLWNTFVT